MRRWCLKIWLAMSLMLLATVLLLWPFSYWRAVYGGYGRVMPYWDFTNEVGFGLRSGRFIIWSGLAMRFGGWIETGPPKEMFDPWNVAEHKFALLGFRIHRFTVAVTPICFIEIPFWFLTLVFASSPALAWRKRRRKLRAKETCLTCGYNLTGNVSGTCPECGTPIRACSK
jgi:hypothetical protein